MKRILAALCLGVFPSFGEGLQIAVASNFVPALEEIAAAFTEEQGIAVRLSAGSSGKLFAQVMNGAPFDLFFSADTVRPRLLEAAGRGVEGSRFTYACGHLVLWSPQKGKQAGPGVLRQGAFNHLAIANPDLAPYGEAAQSLLKELGCWESLQGRVVRGSSVAQAAQFVDCGSADWGLLALSQFQQPGGPARGSMWVPDPSLCPPVPQQAIQLKEGVNARAFLDFMRSEESQRILVTYGYSLPGADHAEPSGS